MITITEFTIESFDGSTGILTLGRLNYGDYMEASQKTFASILEIIAEACHANGYTITYEEDEHRDNLLSLFDEKSASRSERADQR